ncbi:MAG: type II toxin-antitoxin system VapC family toxin [Caldilineaceae bacterium]
MIIGADTGYFINYVSNHPRALQIWQELEAGQHILIVSTLTINELFVYFYRRGIPQERVQRLLSLLQETSQIELTPVSVPIAVRSAPYRHSLGLSTVDAVILATFVETGCELMVTADSDFKTARHQQVIPIELLT